MQLREAQEELARKETEIHKMEVDLVTTDEERKRTEDVVSVYIMSMTIDGLHGSCT